MRLEACTSLEICDASTADPSPFGQCFLRKASGRSVATQQSGKRGGLVDLHADDGFLSQITWQAQLRTDCVHGAHRCGIGHGTHSQE
jgi:hypothetical protein